MEEAVRAFALGRPFVVSGSANPDTSADVSGQGVPMAGFTMDQVEGVWVSRFELLADGALKPIDDATWKYFEWVDMTESGQERRGRVYRRGREVVDPDIF